MHKSIIRKDTYLKRTLLSSGFGCPLCLNFKTESDEVIQRHLSNHSANAVIFQDKFCICRCNLSCRAGGHYHCPFCDGTIMLEGDMVSHLNVCPIKCNVIQPSLVDSCKSPSPETSPHEVNQRHLRNHSANEVLFKGFYMFGSSNVIQPTLEKSCKPSSTETRSLKEDLLPVHKSIIRKDTYLKRTLLSSGFGCPLCPNFKTERDKVIQRHLSNHSANAIIFQDKFCICRCKLFCHFEGHFHCPFCGGTVTKKKDMTFHLTTCPDLSNVILPTLENSSAAHSYPQATSPKTPTPATDFDQTTATTSEKPTIQERGVTMPLTKAESDEVIQKLLRNHNAKAVLLQDLSSRVGGHFHHPFCDSKITTKDFTALHLATCPDKSNVIQPTLVESDHSYSKVALPRTPTPVTDFDQTTPAATSDQLMILEEEVAVPLTNVHKSVIRKDTYLKQSPLTSVFESPLCPNFKTQSDRVIQRDLSNHNANGVHFQENVICRCNLPCRAGDHFHCPFCDKTLTNKDSMALHLIRCQNESTVVQPTLVEPPPETQPLIDHLEPSVSEDPSVSSQTADHAYTQTPTLVTDLNQTTPATTSDQLMIQEEEKTVPLSKTESDEVIQKLLRNHNANAGLFQDLSSRVGGHFHRPFCDSTIATEDLMMFHLTTCPDKSNVIQPTLVESSGDHSYTNAALCETPTPATDFDQTTPATTSEQPTIQEGEVTLPLTNVHKSVIRKDACLKQSQLSSGFGCPLCPNFKTESDEVIQRHLSNHNANGVHFQENVIWRCNLPCRAGDHFHCPFCEKTLTDKDSMTLHLIRCQNESTVVQPTLVEPPPETQPLIDHLEPSVSEDPSVSSQTADHAYTQTPTLVTDLNQTTPATTSDQLTIQDEEVHKSIIWKDTYLERILLPSGFGCPLCPYFNTVNDDVIKRHLRNHNENGVRFQEIVICRCNLSCRVKSHFHCPFCGSTMIRKDNVPLHLKECHVNSPLDLRKLVETQPFKDNLEPSVNEDHYTSSQSADYSYTQTASPKTPAFASTDQPTIEEEEVTVPKAHIKCPHCPLILYRKNLAVHIKRKHSKLEDIAEKSQLKSSCIDQSKDRKASQGLSVQPKAWSLQHHAKSKMKVGRQHHLLCQHSGLSHSMCHRICSGDHLSSMAPMPQTIAKFSKKWRKTRLHYANIAML